MLKNIRMISLVKIFIAIIPFFSLPSYSDEPSASITIYSSSMSGMVYQRLFQSETLDGIQGYAMVRQQKDFDFKSGTNQIVWTGIPKSIDPTSISLKSLSNPENTQLLSLEYRFDLRNNQVLLQKYIGEEITAEQASPVKIDSYQGKLLSVVGGVILQDKNGDIISLNNYSRILFPKLNPPLYSEPTLVCDFTTNKSGIHRLENTYLTDGMAWWAEYQGVFRENKESDGGVFDLAAWVNIVNKSGVAYRDISLNLMAGEVNRASQSTAMMSVPMGYAGKSNQQGQSFSERPLFEYHLYNLNRKISLEEDSIKQIELFPIIHKIPVKLEYRYISNEPMPFYGYPNLNRDLGINFNANPDIYIKFNNSKALGLGQPLPQGRFRMNMEDTNKNLLFIGEALLPHTPVNQDVQLKMGKSFDITVEKRQVNFTIDESRRTMQEKYEIKIKNEKKRDITLMVRENLFRTANWDITDKNTPYEKKDSQTIEFQVPVKSEEESILNYTVKYSW